MLFGDPSIWLMISVLLDTELFLGLFLKREAHFFFQNSLLRLEEYETDLLPEGDITILPETIHILQERDANQHQIRHKQNEAHIAYHIRQCRNENRTRSESNLVSENVQNEIPNTNRLKQPGAVQGQP